MAVRITQLGKAFVISSLASPQVSSVAPTLVSIDAATIAAGFDNNASGDLAISTSPQIILSASGTVTNATADVALKAAISGSWYSLAMI